MRDRRIAGEGIEGIEGIEGLTSLYLLTPTGRRGVGGLACKPDKWVWGGGKRRIIPPIFFGSTH